jgi:hypothetical protein
MVTGGAARRPCSQLLSGFFFLMERGYFWAYRQVPRLRAWPSRRVAW